MSWSWLAFLPEPPTADELADALASATTTDLEGRPAGLLAAWPRGRKPLNAPREFVLRGQGPPHPLVGRGTDSRSGAATPGKHLATAARVDERVIDPTGPPAWVSLVLVPPQVAPLFDDPAVSQAMRRVLAGPPFAAVSTLVRDAVHFAGAVTVAHGEGPARLADDPFARLHPARILRVGPGMFGSVAPPPGPAIQRYSGKPWPAAGFDSR
jgi:hypothetical protein